MSKPIKLLLAIFVGLDIFVVGFLGLSNLRITLFGQGQIPGGGSALDMALFLLPLFLGYLAGDRLYYFLNYKERRARLSQPSANNSRSLVKPDSARAESPAVVGPPAARSVWDEGEWDEAAPLEKK